MDITDKYLDMLESFENDYNLMINDIYGLDLHFGFIKIIKKVTELSMRNLELQRRINETIEIVKSFEYYIPEDNKQELIEILRGIDEKWIE